jgi:KDO2-lipid IV(A) lauroyltransferase
MPTDDMNGGAPPKKQKKAKGAFTQRAEYALYRVVAAPLRAVSSSRIERWSNRTGGVLPTLLKRRSRLVEKNLRIAFPEKSEEERRVIAERCWKYFTGMVFRFLHAKAQSPEEAAATASFDRPEVVEPIVYSGRGLVVVTAHFGDWEHGLHVFNRFDTVPVTVVVRKLDNVLLERDLYRARLRSHVELADRRSAARPLLKTLDQGGVVVLLSDQAVRPREGILVPFLGRDAWTTPAPAKLALRTGAMILCVFARPEGEKVVVEVGPVIDPTTLDEEERTAESVTRMLNDTISARIRRDPELWLWMHDRWKGTETK